MKTLAYRIWTNPVLCSAVGIAAAGYLAAETTGVLRVACGLAAVVFAVTAREAVTPNRKLDE